MKKQILLATTDPQAKVLAKKYDIGLEIDEFCTAYNMDKPNFYQWDAKVRPIMPLAKAFHAPFSELFPCAIDPKARALARERLDQAYELMREYGIKKLIVHGGFVPQIYDPIWYVEQSISFWKDFLKEKSEDFLLCIENVMEPKPELLCEIAREVHDKRCGLCLDVGHANIRFVTEVPLEEWITVCRPYLKHLHLHDNRGSFDEHAPIGQGAISERLWYRIFDLNVPMTLEHGSGTENSIKWLKERKII